MRRCCITQSVEGKSANVAVVVRDHPRYPGHMPQNVDRAGMRTEA